MKMKTPNSIKPHANKFKRDAWKEYTLAELGQWVHLLAKRADHRSELEKHDKDLMDARNYWVMMGEHLKAMMKKAEVRR